LLTIQVTVLNLIVFLKFQLIVFIIIIFQTLLLIFQQFVNIEFDVKFKFKLFIVGAVSVVLLKSIFEHFIDNILFKFENETLVSFDKLL